VNIHPNASLPIQQQPCFLNRQKREGNERPPSHQGEGRSLKGLTLASLIQRTFAPINNAAPPESGQYPNESHDTQEITKVVNPTLGITNGENNETPPSGQAEDSPFISLHHSSTSGSPCLSPIVSHTSHGQPPASQNISHSFHSDEIITRRLRQSGQHRITPSLLSHASGDRSNAIPPLRNGENRERNKRPPSPEAEDSPYKKICLGDSSDSWRPSLWREERVQTIGQAQFSQLVPMAKATPHQSGEHPRTPSLPSHASQDQMPAIHLSQPLSFSVTYPSLSQSPFASSIRNGAPHPLGQYPMTPSLPSHASGDQSRMPAVHLPQSLPSPIVTASPLSQSPFASRGNVVRHQSDPHVIMPNLFSNPNQDKSCATPSPLLPNVRPLPPARHVALNPSSSPVKTDVGKVIAGCVLILNNIKKGLLIHESLSIARRGVKHLSAKKILSLVETFNDFHNMAVYFKSLPNFPPESPKESSSQQEFILAANQILSDPKILLDQGLGNYLSMLEILKEHLALTERLPRSESLKLFQIFQNLVSVVQPSLTPRNSSSSLAGASQSLSRSAFPQQMEIVAQRNTVESSEQAIQERNAAPHPHSSNSRRPSPSNEELVQTIGQAQFSQLAPIGNATPRQSGECRMTPGLLSQIFVPYSLSQSPFVSSIRNATPHQPGQHSMTPSLPSRPSQMSVTYPSLSQSPFASSIRNAAPRRPGQYPMTPSSPSHASRDESQMPAVHLPLPSAMEILAQRNPFESSEQAIQDILPDPLLPLQLNDLAANNLLLQTENIRQRRSLFSSHSETELAQDYYWLSLIVKEIGLKKEEKEIIKINDKRFRAIAAKFQASLPRLVVLFNSLKKTLLFFESILNKNKYNENDLVMYITYSIFVDWLNSEDMDLGSLFYSYDRLSSCELFEKIKEKTSMGYVFKTEKENNIRERLSIYRPCIGRRESNYTPTFAAIIYAMSRKDCLLHQNSSDYNEFMIKLSKKLENENNLFASFLDDRNFLSSKGISTPFQWYITDCEQIPYSTITEKISDQTEQLIEYRIIRNNKKLRQEFLEKHHKEQCIYDVQLNKSICMDFLKNSKGGKSKYTKAAKKAVSAILKWLGAKESLFEYCLRERIQLSAMISYIAYALAKDNLDKITREKIEHACQTYEFSRSGSPFKSPPLTKPSLIEFYPPFKTADRIAKYLFEFRKESERENDDLISLSSWSFLRHKNIKGLSRGTLNIWKKKMDCMQKAIDDPSSVSESQDIMEASLWIGRIERWVNVNKKAPYSINNFCVKFLCGHVIHQKGFHIWLGVFLGGIDDQCNQHELKKLAWAQLVREAYYQDDKSQARLSKIADMLLLGK